MPQASSSTMVCKNHLEKETKRRISKAHILRFHVMWASLSTRKKKTKNLHFKDKLFKWILLQVAFGQLRKPISYLSLAFLLMCPNYFSILAHVFSDFGKYQVFKPFPNFPNGILPSLIFTYVNKPTSIGIPVSVLKGPLHHSHGATRGSLHTGEEPAYGTLPDAGKRKFLWKVQF